MSLGAFLACLSWAGLELAQGRAAAQPFSAACTPADGVAERDVSRSAPPGAQWRSSTDPTPDYEITAGEAEDTEDSEDYAGPGAVALSFSLRATPLSWSTCSSTRCAELWVPQPVVASAKARAPPWALRS